MSRTDFTAIVPVKSLDLGKSRLHPDARVRQLLAHAFALDTIGALRCAQHVARIVVVTHDAVVGAEARELGAQVVAERRGAGADPLDDAVVSGRAWAIEHFPQAPVVVVPADLPSATGPDIDAVLSSVAEGLSFVRDDAGAGTTLLLASAPGLLDAAYGGHSARAHRSRGAHEVDTVSPGLRRDVDTMAGLDRAVEAGVGEHTSLALAGLRKELARA